MLSLLRLQGSLRARARGGGLRCKLLLLFPAMLPNRTLFCAVARGKEKVRGSIKAWLAAFLHQGKSKARLTWNGQILYMAK